MNALSGAGRRYMKTSINAHASVTHWRHGKGVAEVSGLGLLVTVGLISSCAPPVVPLPVTNPTAGSSRLPKCSTLRADGSAPVIDDFDGDYRQIPANEGRKGWWFDYGDGTSGHYRREVVKDSDGAKGHVLHVTASQFLKWGAGFGVHLHPNSNASVGCAYDASRYAGIRLRAKGHGRVRMMLGDAASTSTAKGGTCDRGGDRCFDRPGVWLDLTDDWRPYKVAFCGLVPEGWGGSRQSVDPSKLFTLFFKFDERDNAELWLEDIAFYESSGGGSASHCGMPCPLDALPRSAKLEPSLVPTASGLSVHVFEQATRSCGPITRRYLSYVASSLGSRTSRPVLMMLHGRSSNAESARSFMARDRFDALAERDGALVVYGNAAPGSYTSPNPNFPNTGAWRQGFFDDGQVDDVAYLEAVLDDLKRRAVIDGRNKVFLSGISNGGGMVLEAARRIPQRFQGIAAFMPYEGDEPKRVPDLLGTPIRRLLFAYGIDDPGMAQGYHDVLSPIPAQWAAAMGLSVTSIAAPIQSELPNLVHEGLTYAGKDPVALATRNSRVVQHDMVTLGVDRRVRVLVLDHAGHFWPNAQQDSADWVLEHWGFRNQDFDAADMTWDFLQVAAD